MGRDERANQDRLKILQGNFQKGVADGSMPALDRFGQPIRPGQMVLYQNAYGLVCTVTDVKPILDPRAPVGMVQLTLTTEFPLPVPARQPLPMLLVIGVAGTPAEEPPPPADDDLKVGGTTLDDEPPPETEIVL